MNETLALPLTLDMLFNLFYLLPPSQWNKANSSTCLIGWSEDYKNHPCKMLRTVTGPGEHYSVFVLRMIIIVTFRGAVVSLSCGMQDL